MLDFRQGFRGGNHASQTFVVELVRGGASRASGKDSANRDDVVFILHVLMNRVVGETREREVRAGEKNFDFVGGREFLDAVEDVGGLFSSKHSNWF